MLNKHIICLTPDRNFFSTAVFAAQKLLNQGLTPAIDIALVCSPDDIDPNIAIDTDNRLQLLTHTFEMPDKLSLAALPLGRHITMAAYRRLLLPYILPDQYTQIVYLDCDTLCVREGIDELFSINLQSHAFAAALDMILLKDFENGPLTETFQHYRTSLGFTHSTHYFNSGVLLIDREQWLAQTVTERTLEFAHTFPERCQYQDQSALNAVTKGQWLPLSPRFNFMGDFLLLNLMQEIKPVVLHFVNDPKPWQTERWNGPAWMQILYEAGRANVSIPKEPSLTAAFVRFRERLLGFLAEQDFADNFQIFQA